MLGAVVAVTQLVMTFVFWGLIAADHAGHFSLITDEYRETGFCRANSFSDGFDSYQLCFVVDMLGCLALTALWWGGQKKGINTVGPAASIFMHGIFHMAQFLFGWPLPVHVERVVSPLFVLSFVGGFGVGSKVGTTVHLVVIAAAIELFRVTFVSPPFAFAYANSWIYAVATGVGATQQVMAAVASTPAGSTTTQQPAATPSPAPSIFIFFGAVLPFCEAILCDHGIKALGGHALFDTTIVLGTVATAMSSPSATEVKKQS
jgi:hypothetical protein|eukprot:COSAG01_NODE_6600_length_3585_cov_155.033276_6_plen_261_part_00